MNKQELLDLGLTHKQAEVMELHYLGYSQPKGALELGISRDSFKGSLNGARTKLAQRGITDYDDNRHLVPDGYKIKGTSTLQKTEDGGIQWVKVDEDKERQKEIMEAAIEAMKEDIKPLKKIKKINKKHNKNLLNLYTLTDFHLGMLAWGEETGADWDLKIAEEMMVGAFKHLIDATPEAEVGFFNELGDFEHYDSHMAVTPTNKHILDADGRPVKMIRTSIRVQRQVIEMMAEKYNKVVVLNAEGNHNIISSVWKRELFSELYRNNPRIEVITDPLPYYAYEWGKNMLGFHHGHLKKFDKMAEVFIANFREMYGRTTNLHIHSGHMHHRELKELATAILEMHPTLAASDAHGARGGYHSQRAMQAITYHRDFLETSRVIFRPEML